MIISRSWIQEYFKEKLPDTKEVVEALTMRAFEIESFEKKGDDEVIDVKVLPNRAHDCLCHKGIAREIATILGKKFIGREIKPTDGTGRESGLKIKIDNPELCPRYMGRRLENVAVKNSPDWLRKKMEVLGERSINNVVDITNYIMLDVGQPMHVFDADKVKGEIHVRSARKEEKIILLTGEGVVLDENVLLIADEEGPLAIAGIKGGKRAEVTENTKNIILESANFSPTMVRKTSQKLGIKNNSSKRYENEISPELAELAMHYATKLIIENSSGENLKIYKTEDFYSKKAEQKKIKISLLQVNNLLGTNLSEGEVEDIFNKTGLIWEKTNGEFTITAPHERLDLGIKEDLVEEIGRIYGYERIRSILPEGISNKPEVNENFVITQKVRLALADLGYSEVFNYAFRERGEIEIENPIASNKAFLRNNLADGLKESLEMNMKNAPFLGLNEIKIFEIGTVFGKNGEKMNVVWGIKNKKEIKIEEYGLEEAAEKLNLKETNMPDLIQGKDTKFKPFSSYPFILRDIAVWVLKGTEGTEVLKFILENTGELLVKHRLFDVFTKEEKISYAFSLVFQSPERTLTDSEINKIMEKITAVLNAQNGWQVR